MQANMPEAQSQRIAQTEHLSAKLNTNYDLLASSPRQVIDPATTNSTTLLHQMTATAEENTTANFQDQMIAEKQLELIAQIRE